MENIRSENSNRTGRFCPFVLFLFCGLATFFVGITFSPVMTSSESLAARITVSLIFLLLTFILYRNERLKKYWPIFFSFFIASFVLLLSWRYSSWPLHLFDLSVHTANGLAIAKLSEAVIIVLSIIILTKISGGDMPSIFLKAGRLTSGLIIGLISFVVFTALAIWQAASQGVELNRLFLLTPWILIFVLANGFMEELLFRGIFLNKFKPILGPGLSNLLTAIVFALAHMKVTYTPDVPIFLIITFILALLWGYIMQKTDSIIGSALFHAGADTLIMMGIFASYGITP